MQGKSVTAVVPVAMLQDAINIIVNAPHANYRFQQVAQVVNALNQCVETAVREYANASKAGASVPVSDGGERDTGGTSPDA